MCSNAAELKELTLLCAHLTRLKTCGALTQWNTWKAKLSFRNQKCRFKKSKIITQLPIPRLFLSQNQMNHFNMLEWKERLRISWKDSKVWKHQTITTCSIRRDILRISTFSFPAKNSFTEFTPTCLISMLLTSQDSLALLREITMRRHASFKAVTLNL